MRSRLAYYVNRKCSPDSVRLAASLAKSMEHKDSRERPDNFMVGILPLILLGLGRFTLGSGQKLIDRGGLILKSGDRLTLKSTLHPAKRPLTCCTVLCNKLDLEGNAVLSVIVQLRLQCNGSIT